MSYHQDNVVPRGRDVFYLKDSPDTAPPGPTLSRFLGKSPSRPALSKVQLHGSKDSTPAGQGVRVMACSWLGSGEKLALRYGVFMWGEVGDSPSGRESSRPR